MTDLRPVALFVILAVVAPVAQSTDLDSTPNSLQKPQAPLYVVEYDTGPAYLPGRPFAEQPGFKEHAEYMSQLESDGSLILGGPHFSDLETLTLSGALLFFKVKSIDEARELAENDPAISHGLMTIAGVKPFLVMIEQF